MKSFRWTLIAIMLVAGFVAFTVYDSQRSEKVETAKEDARKVLKISREKLNRFEIINRAGSIVLEKQGESWRLAAPIKDLVDVQTVESFLASIESEKTVTVVLEGADLKLETFGLKEPVTRLKLATSDGSAEEIKIGSVKAYDNSLYAQIDNENRVYSVTQSWDPLLAKSVDEFRDKHLLRKDFKIEDLVRIEFAMPDFSLTKTGETWKLTGTKFDYPVNQESVAQFIDALKGVRGLSFQKKGAVTNSDGGLKLLGKQSKVPLFEASFDKQKSGNTVYAKSSDYQETIVLASTIAETIRKTPNEFFDKKLPFKFSPDVVTEIELVTKSRKSLFIKTATAWGLKEKKDGESINLGKIEELAKKVSDLSAIRILEPMKANQAIAKFKTYQHLAFRNAAHELIFEMRWGEQMIEKAAATQPEARYLLAWTNKADVLLGVTEGELANLGVDQIFSTETKTDQAKAAKK